MAVSIFVQDGYSITDTIPATPGLHPAVRFTYRPCTGPEARAFAAAPEAKADDAASKLMLSHVENQTFTPIYDPPLVGPDGKPLLEEPVVLTAETLKKLNSNLWNGILNRVLNYTGPAVGNSGN